MIKAPIHTWIEPIDGSHSAVVSCCEYTSYGAYYAASFFLIADCKPESWASRRSAEEAGERHFREQLHNKYGGHLPYVCRTGERRH